MNPLTPLTKTYEPHQFEKQIYEFWQKQGAFKALDNNQPGQKAFAIMIPPPNVTGVLHMGHALTCTLEDILVRWRRMCGDNTLWMPGTDHAGIATQAQVEKQIAKEGKGSSGKPLTRHDLGREKFIARSWKWKEEHAGQIQNQLKRLGSSLDWDRERFTMDPGFSKAVREVFVTLYEQGLLYKGERIINWCPRCQTALSDLEVIPHDRKSTLWHIAYPVVGPVMGEDKKIVIATTRPETMLGDTAVAVHPEDDRYQYLKGKKVKLPLLNKELPIIFDEYVQKDFGSGALKVTPAHDFNDYDLGKKHGLEFVQVMGKDGRITSLGGPYAGLKFLEAREKIVQDLTDLGLLIKTEENPNKVGLCQRCDHVAEPIVSAQWFVKIASLAEPAIRAVETGKITFTPKSWENTYFEWMRNIRDWCVSRQLWWGHQIPAWSCQKCNELTVSRQDPKSCTHCGAAQSELVQDPDVLDTWFSSGLWPFVTLGWPEKTQALKTFYPGEILETGFDIIFFWVARMIMLGLHFMGEVPFKKVYLHAMVRDEKGEKMSKSRGNVIDPLGLIDQHGADALRLTLAAMAGQGRDIKLSTDRVEGYRAFCNKLWNAVKFLHFQLEEAQGEHPPSWSLADWKQSSSEKLLPLNQWILGELEKVKKEVWDGLENFEIDHSTRSLYEFIWYELCDWYIELSKLYLREKGEMRHQTLQVLSHVLDQTLKLLHPITPFLTEQLWQTLPTTLPGAFKGKVLMKEDFPTFKKEKLTTDFTEAQKNIRSLKNVIEAIRNFRGENNISPKTEFKVFVSFENESSKNFFNQNHKAISVLSRLSTIEEAKALAPGGAKNLSVFSLLDPSVKIGIELKGLVDEEAEKQRLLKEIQKTQEDLDRVTQKLSRESFIAKAPAELVTKEREKQQEYQKRLNELKQTLSRI